MIKKIQHTLILPTELRGQRLDQALAKLLPDYSRVLIQKWLKTGEAKFKNHKEVKSKTLVAGGEIIVINAQLEPKTEWLAQALPLDVVFEDESLMIINKPVGLIVHPGSGNPDHTLVNALLHRNPDLESLPRAG